MQFPNRQPIEELAALGMPKPVILNHGAAMVARGYRAERPNGDIDGCIDDERGENWAYLTEQLGFIAVRKVVGISNRTGKPIEVDVLQDEKERFDFHRHDWSPHRHMRGKPGRISYAESIAMSDLDEETGIYVATKRLLLLEKMDSPREQDKFDVGRINDVDINGF
jgi:hypothetical protein